MSTKIHILLASTISFVAIAAICALDYINILGKINLNSNMFNYEVLGIAINAIVVVSIAILTFLCLDSKNAKKIENQKRSANLILYHIYSEIRKRLDELNEPKQLHSLGRDYDNGKRAWIEKRMYLPFENENLLIEFVKDGSICGEQLIYYQQIKTSYIDVYWMSIAFHKIEEAYEKERGYLISQIDCILDEKKNLYSEYIKEISA